MLHWISEQCAFILKPYNKNVVNSSGGQCAFRRKFDLSTRANVSRLWRLISLISLLAIFSTAYLGKTHAAKILAAYVFPGKSHFMMNTAIIREVIKRGHEVTCITSFSLKDENFGKNYTEILIAPKYEFWPEVKKVFKVDNIFDFSKLPIFKFMKLCELVGIKTTEHALKHPKVQQIIKFESGKRKFDLFLAEQFYQEAFLALAYKFNIPVVTTCTLGYLNYMSQMMGIISPWSFVPHGLLPYDDHMNFYERLVNSFYSLYEDFRREHIYFPQQDQLVQKYFTQFSQKIPRVTEMEKNISMIFINSYVPWTSPRPTAMGMVPVGGVHIADPKALPTDLQLFLDEATSGVIYFSLGTQVKSTDMLVKKVQMFLEVFAGLKQRVLWKFDDENIPNLPCNVMVKKWMPQNDVLAHHNVKVFITHGGLFGTQEAIHFGVPMLGIPVYGDQHVNIDRAAKRGLAIKLNFEEVTNASLKSALSTLLQDSSYQDNIKRFSKIFRDRPMDVKETAMYWIEYVIRYKGAPHLRSAGLDLEWYQFYLLDVIAFVLAITYVCWVFVLVGARRLFHKDNLLRVMRKRKQH